MSQRVTQFEWDWSALQYPIDRSLTQSTITKQT